MTADTASGQSSSPSTAATGIRQREGLASDTALIVADGVTVPLLNAPCGVWGFLVAAVEFLIGADDLTLFTAQPLENQPDAHNHDGDVVRLQPSPDHGDNLVDVTVLVARHGTWEQVELRIGLGLDWPQLLAPALAEQMSLQRDAIA